MSYSDKLRYHFADNEHGIEKTFYGNPVPMAIVDRDGIFLDCNAAYSGFFGYTPGEIIGKSYKLYTHPDDVQADSDAMRNLLSRVNGMESYQMDKRYLRKLDSKSIPFRLYVRAVYARDDNCAVPSFSHFFCIALPYPNGGIFKHEQRSGKVVVRPDLKLTNVIKDNKLTVAITLIILSLINKDIREIILALIK